MYYCSSSAAISLFHFIPEEMVDETFYIYPIAENTKEFHACIRCIDPPPSSAIEKLAPILYRARAYIDAEL